MPSGVLSKEVPPLATSALVRGAFIDASTSGLATPSFAEPLWQLEVSGFPFQASGSDLRVTGPDFARVHAEAIKCEADKLRGTFS